LVSHRAARALAAVRLVAVAVGKAGQARREGASARRACHVLGIDDAVAGLRARAAMRGIAPRVRLAAGVAGVTVRKAARASPRAGACGALRRGVLVVANDVASATIEEVCVGIDAQASAALSLGAWHRGAAALDARAGRTARLATGALGGSDALDALMPRGLAVRSRRAELAVALLLAAERALEELVAETTGRARVGRAPALHARLGR
jgi:hypothetical protein